jgi:3-oxoacyl-[acyl-carrier protein] reductase
MSQDLNALPLHGKVALVTGGSRGIGAAAVLALSQAGAHVVFTWSSSEEQAAALEQRASSEQTRVTGLRADAADREHMDTLVARVVALHGRLDILVNNAGIGKIGKVDELSDADFDALFEVNVRAPFALARAASAVMAPGSSIINIGSISAHSVPGPGFAAYGAAKAALAQLGRGWARDLGERQITVNTIHPGPIDTDMNPASGPFAAVLTPLTALGRYGRADEVASLITYLASPQARYITGANIDIDGGISV